MDTPRRSLRLYLNITMASEESSSAVVETVKKTRRSRRAGTRLSRRRARRQAAMASVALTTNPFTGAVSPNKCAVHMFLFRYQTALRCIPAHLPPTVHAGPPSKRVKRVSWRKSCSIYSIIPDYYFLRSSLEQMFWR